MKKAMPPIAARLKRGDRSATNRTRFRRSNSQCGDHVVPDKVGVVTQRHKSLSDSGSDGVGEQSDSLDDRSHVLGGLGVGVFQDGDGGEDLRETDEGVRTDLRPNVDGSGEGLETKGSMTVSSYPQRATYVSVLVGASVGVVSTGAHPVDVQLRDGSPVTKLYEQSSI